MSFRDRISKFVNVNENQYYDDTPEDDIQDGGYYDEPDEPEQDIPVAKKSAFGSFRATEKSRSNVVDFNQGDPSQRAKGQVVLAKPATLDEVTAIADHVNQKHMVILNLESTNRDVARRLVDFLRGAVYANGGKMQRVSGGTFAIIPDGYGLSGDDVLDGIENLGFNFG